MPSFTCHILECQYVGDGANIIELFRIWKMVQNLVCIDMWRTGIEEELVMVLVVFSKCEGSLGAV